MSAAEAPAAMGRITNRPRYRLETVAENGADDEDEDDDDEDDDEDDDGTKASRNPSRMKEPSVSISSLNLARAASWVRPSNCCKD